MTFVLVGHCGPDVFLLRNALQRASADTPIVTINDSDALNAHRDAGNLLLVNRVLDGSFGSTDGVDLIRRLRDDDAHTILVSNYEDAQSEAEAAGALPGFGKRDLYEPETLDRLRAGLSATGAST